MAQAPKTTDETATEPTVETIEFPASVAALAVIAATNVTGYAVNVDGHEAVKQSDGSIRLAVRQKDGSGCIFYFVRIPETLTLILRETPTEEE